MKVGSLVTRVKNGQGNPLVKWKPAWGEVVTIREFYTTQRGRKGIRFEEGVMGYTSKGIEIGALRDSFRELQPPMDLTELMEEVMSQTV